MKNSSLILNVVLLIAVGVLYILYFTQDKTTLPQNIINENGVVTSGTKIAYINTDSLWSNYLLSVELNEEFYKKQEERSTELNSRAKDLDRQAMEYQRKLENNGFINRERAEAAAQDLLNKSQRLELLQQEMTEQMIQEQTALRKRLYDDISSFLTEYNKKKGYDLIISTTMYGNILHAEPGFDLTNEVITELNERYNGINKAD